MQSIYGLTQDEMKDLVLELGEKAYRADQIWQWLYRQHVESFEAMNNIPKPLLEALAERYSFSPLKAVIVQKAKDKTQKFLFELHDKSMIETVLMYHSYGVSVCVTTQIGCNIGCKFCASGLIPKVRDLEAGEIVAQIMHVQRHLDKEEPGTKVSHIVVMGIGEPFDNYTNVMKFLRIVNSDKGLAIGARHITVSTSGLAPKIKEFAREGIQVNLAVSLHGPDNETRSSIMKINNQYPLEELFEAIYEYIDLTNRRVTFEYIMIDGVNDTPEHAKRLAKLLKPILKLSYVNLIPYNPVAENPFQRSTPENIAKFFDLLMQNKVNCVVRREHGTEIDAACGQLRSRYERKRQAAKPTRSKVELRKISQERRAAKLAERS